MKKKTKEKKTINKNISSKRSGEKKERDCLCKTVGWEKEGTKSKNKM